MDPLATTAATANWMTIGFRSYDTAAPSYCPQPLQHTIQTDKPSESQCLDSARRRQRHRIGNHELTPRREDDPSKLCSVAPESVVTTQDPEQSDVDTSRHQPQQPQQQHCGPPVMSPRHSDPCLGMYQGFDSTCAAAGTSAQSSMSGDTKATDQYSLPSQLGNVDEHQSGGFVSNTSGSMRVPRVPPLPLQTAVNIPSLRMGTPRTPHTPHHLGTARLPKTPHIVIHMGTPAEIGAGTFQGLTLADCETPGTTTTTTTATTTATMATAATMIGTTNAPLPQLPNPPQLIHQDFLHQTSPRYQFPASNFSPLANTSSLACQGGTSAYSSPEGFFNIDTQLWQRPLGFHFAPAESPRQQTLTDCMSPGLPHAGGFASPPPPSSYCISQTPAECVSLSPAGADIDVRHPLVPNYLISQSSPPNNTSPEDTARSVASLSGSKRDTNGGYVDSASALHQKGDVRLFVGRIPKWYTNRDLKKLFDSFGQVLECNIIRDRRAAQSQGCGFVRLASVQIACSAIEVLNQTVSLDPDLGPVQVKFASGELERLGLPLSLQPGGECVKVFFGNLTLNTTEAELRQLFGAFGRFEELCVLRDRNKRSKCSGFVTFNSTEDAEAAIMALNGQHYVAGATRPLEVRFAESRAQRGVKTQRSPKPEHSRSSQLADAAALAATTTTTAKLDDAKQHDAAGEGSLGVVAAKSDTTTKTKGKRSKRVGKNSR